VPRVERGLREQRHLLRRVWWEQAGRPVCLGHENLNNAPRDVDRMTERAVEHIPERQCTVVSGLLVLGRRPGLRRPPGRGGVEDVHDTLCLYEIEESTQ
jgi:hypothetical protein